MKKKKKERKKAKYGYVGVFPVNSDVLKSRIFVVRRLEINSLEPFSLSKGKPVKFSATQHTHTHI